MKILYIRLASSLLLFCEEMLAFIIYTISTILLNGDLPHSYILHKHYMFSLLWCMIYCICHDLIASQSSVSFSETSGDSANSKCSSANTNTEEHFFTAQSPDLLVQNSSATTTTTNDPVTTCTLDKTFPQIQTSQQHNQSVESQNVAQNLRHQPEASDVDQSIVIQKYQQQPFAAMQNTSQLLEQPHNILISHQQDVQHIQTETIQQDCQHISESV